MSIGNADTQLSKEHEVKTRTDFKQHKHKFWQKGSYGSAELEVIRFMESFPIESNGFITNPMFQFFYDWLKASCDYYKDILSVNPDNSKDAKFRGIIAGQREMLVMMDYMRKERPANKTQEV
jgi:hypothetical protein